MRLRNSVCALALFALAAGPAPAAEDFRLVFIAYQNPDQLVDNVEPVVEYLEARLGVGVKAYVATDYAAVVEALRGETADAGFMGPLQYVLAHQEAGAYPILGEVYSGSSTYVSRIFVRKDSGIESVEQLKDHSIAFVDPLSSSGYMYPLDVFRQQGLIDHRDDADAFFGRIYFAGGDEQAIRAVYNGFVDAAGIGQYSFTLLRPEERDQMVAIGESRPIPSHCVVVRKGADPELVDGLREALLALNDGPNRNLLEQLYNVDGYVEVDHSTYAGVAELAKEYGFVRE
ncbi:MAG: phosphate/phosphite/phosphonate ABC transporter substrate-binding protein [Acidobacteria bacterium]|nr:phosphate/phosphite/phosphonate ABC transporter substrate-binding protein [Acidobacteriota bacterium]